MSDANVQAKTKPAWDPADVHATKLPPLFSLRWTSRSLSMAIANIVLMQLTFYLTDIQGLDPVIIGGLMLAAKIFDAFSDLVASDIEDHTHTRWGKARPYELCIIPVWVTIVILFSTPDMSDFGKYVYIFVTYVLLSGVFMTFLNTQDSTYLRRSLRGGSRISKVLSRKGVLQMLLSGLGHAALPQLIVLWGEEPGGWTKITLVYAIPMTIIGLIRCLTIKELPEEVLNATQSQKELDKAARKAAEPKIDLKTSIKTLFSNRYMWMVAGMVMVCHFAINVVSAVNTHFFKYVVGDIGFMSYVSIIGLLPTFLVLLMPVAIKKIGAMGFIRIGLIVAFVGYGIVGLFSHILPLVIVGQVMGSMGTGLFTTFSSFFVIQCMSYGEWKTGYKLEAMMDAMPSFANKIAQGLSATIAGFGLAAVGFDSTLETQSAFTQGGLTVMVSLVPILFVAIALVLSQMYRKLDKNIMKVDEDLATGIHADTSNLKL